MPRAKGMFELGTLGMLGTLGWGATGSLGNLARAASISSLLIIAFVAALTCLGAISEFYITVSPLFQVGKLQEVSSAGGCSWCLQVCRHKLVAGWERGSEVSQRRNHTDSQHRLSRQPF